MIRIIRNEDDPKAKLVARFKLNDAQVEAILNTRLKAISKLEEIEIRAEHDRLSKERAASVAAQVGRAAVGARGRRGQGHAVKPYSKKTALGRRRSTLRRRPRSIEVDLDQAMIEKEPITVILSEKGWIRAMKGHQDDLSKLEFKQGDQLLRVRSRPTPPTSSCCSPPTARCSRWPATSSPAAAATASRCRLMVDLEENHAFSAKPGCTPPAAGSSSPPPPATASWCRRTRWSP